MKKDIHIPVVSNIAMAIVKEYEEWYAYLINQVLCIKLVQGEQEQLVVELIVTKRKMICQDFS